MFSETNYRTLSSIYAATGNSMMSKRNQLLDWQTRRT